MHKYKMNAGDVMFTGDQHFGHANIIRFCERPFKDVNHMNEEMVDRWNEVVRPDQTVFHLGDFAFKGRDRTVPYWLNRLNGNHDKPKDGRHFSNTHDLAELVVRDGEKEQRIIMCHYGMRVWNHSFRGSWHIYGHSHGTLPPRMDRKEEDVGVDCWDFKPISYWELKGAMSTHGQEELDDLHTRAGYTKENIHLTDAQIRAGIKG
jgi:calcineurin-like phosphoesterase family protein